MAKSSDESINYEDIFNSYMSTLCTYSRQHINSLKSNKTKSDYDTNDNAIDEHDDNNNKHNIKKIKRGGEKARKQRKKTIIINNHLNNSNIWKQ